MTQPDAQRKVLIISYYWPPSGGAGVQRWLKFSKYLPEHGWKPVIYTPENPEYPAVDENLLADIHPEVEVIKSKIWEPYSLYKKLTARNKEAKIGTGFTSEKERISLAEKASRWIRGNWFIPDARKFWIKPSIKFLSEYLKENPVNAIISTGPPHSMHLIALGIKNKFPALKWIADFRDPWTNIDFVDELRLSKRSSAKHNSLETEVLTTADHVSTAWHLMKTEFSQKVLAEKIKVILNGFDLTDLEPENITLDQKFTIAHLGSFSPTRNVPILWEVLGELTRENSAFKGDLEIKVAGYVDGSVNRDIQSNGLSENLVNSGYVTHKQAVRFMLESQVLLLVVNNTKVAKGIIPGKVFEYIMSDRPILSIGPKDSDIAKLMTSVGADKIINYNERVELKERIVRLYNAFNEGDLNAGFQDVAQYDRRNLTKQFVQILNHE